MSTALDKFLKRIQRAGDLDLWSVVDLVRATRALVEDDQTTAVIAIARTLIRQRALLGFAGDLLATVATRESYWVLDAQADLAGLSGKTKDETRLRRLAAAAADAPTADERLRSEWATAEVKARENPNDSAEKRLERLDGYFAARKKLKTATKS